MFTCKFCKISKNTFSNRTPPVGPSEKWTIVKPITLQITFFTQVAGNRVSDHYARNLYIKIFLQVANLWMSVPLKILHQNNKIVRNTYNKCGAGLQHGTSPVVSFSRIFSKY